MLRLYRDLQKMNSTNCLKKLSERLFKLRERSADDRVFAIRVRFRRFHVESELWIGSRLSGENWQEH
ncbi:hypothetical protein LT85_0981 [Collimonas arenae]|uniref:Uncharacterized protein n=1 Tax=Collimonas arenae TaxID=279058 RepID=A0A0A1F8X9_9BURK|nr:hypothetical protein LT85_0981 [Collimonas arenae]